MFRNIGDGIGCGTVSYSADDPYHPKDKYADFGDFYIWNLAAYATEKTVVIAFNKKRNIVEVSGLIPRRPQKGRLDSNNMWHCGFFSAQRQFNHHVEGSASTCHKVANGSLLVWVDKVSRKHPESPTLRPHVARIWSRMLRGKTYSFYDHVKKPEASKETVRQKDSKLPETPKEAEKEDAEVAEGPTTESEPSPETVDPKDQQREDSSKSSSSSSSESPEPVSESTEESKDDSSEKSTTSGNSDSSDLSVKQDEKAQLVVLSKTSPHSRSVRRSSRHSRSSNEPEPEVRMARRRPLSKRSAHHLQQIAHDLDPDRVFKSIVQGMFNDDSKPRRSVRAPRQFRRSIHRRKQDSESDSDASHGSVTISGGFGQLRM